MIKGKVFDIERFAIEDGPGIRTIVFLKGCPLKCKWCANPESQNIKTEIMYYINKCKGCGRCIEQCPQKAIDTDEKYGLVTDHSKCIGCGKCVDACYYAARKVTGKYMTVEEVMNELEKDVSFYKKSGGGVTVSGGEVLVQADFTKELLKACKDKNIHTAIETCGYGSWKEFEKLIPYLDLVFFDIKHINEKEHIKGTGVSNEKIINNLKKLDIKSIPIIVRIPFIPGYNSDVKVQQKIYKFVSKLNNVIRIEVLPYHRLGISKYKSLGKDYELEKINQVKKSEIKHLIEIGKQYNVTVRIGAVENDK